jgi:hypothetical protein
MHKTKASEILIKNIYSVCVSLPNTMYCCIVTLKLICSKLKKLLQYQSKPGRVQMNSHNICRHFITVAAKLAQYLRMINYSDLKSPSICYTVHPTEI